jgi:hypothetical protein
MLTETELASDERADNKGRRISGRTSAKLWVAAGLAGIVFVGAWLKYSPGASGSSAGAPPAALPQVVVSKPLAQDIDTRLGFLGRAGFAGTPEELDTLLAEGLASKQLTEDEVLSSVSKQTDALR